MEPLRLRPGLHVVRRDDHHVQVGVDPPWRVLAPDEPAVRRLLDDLVEGRPVVPDSPAAHRTLAALAEAGMVTGPAPEPASRRVAVHATGGLRAELTRLLRLAGCEPEADAEVAVVAAAGQVRRTESDALLRTGTAHLLLSADARGWTVGPFVVPGRTACLRCVDAHRGEHDPRRALVVDQLAGRPGAPDDPVLSAIAAAWAVRDLLTFLDGGEPATWSRTVELGPDLRPRPRAWTRHLHCGCAWSAP